MGNRHHRDAEKEIYWRSILRKFETSGMSVRAFCAKEKIQESMFYAWRREIRLRDGEKRLSDRAPAKDTLPEAEFVPVVLAAPLKEETASKGCVVEISAPGGFVIRVSKDVDPGTLRVVLATIKRA